MPIFTSAVRLAASGGNEPAGPYALLIKPRRHPAPGRLTKREQS
jgi:hypothetical protein